MKQSLGNVLIVKMSAIGDVIHALPVAYAIKETYPNTHLTWIVEKAAYELVAANPYIDQVILFEKEKFRSLSGLIENFSSLAQRLKNGRFDIVLDLQGLAKSAAIAWLSRAPKRLGFCNMREGSSFVSKPVCGLHQQGSIVERYVDVARELGCRVDKIFLPIDFSEDEQHSVRQKAAAAGLCLEQPFVVLIPGANWPNKRWPTAAFAKLIDRLASIGLPTVVVGGPGDQELAADIAAQAKGKSINLVGQTSLKELACLISKSSAVVGGDTGPMHLAAGMGKPAIALMGPTDANRNGPYGQTSHAIEVSYDCAGCWQRKCPKGWDCLADITEEQVFSLLEKILKGGSYEHTERNQKNSNH